MILLTPPRFKSILSPKTIQRNQLLLQKCKHYQNRNASLSSSAAVSAFSDLAEEDNPHFPNLFKSLFLGPEIGSLPNRVIMGSMHTGLEVCFALASCYQLS